VEYSAYSPDRLLSNYHLFPVLKQKLGGHRLKDYRKWKQL